MTPDTDLLEDADDEASAIIERVATGSGVSAEEVAWAREWVRLGEAEKARRLAKEAAA